MAEKDKKAAAAGEQKAKPTAAAAATDKNAAKTEIESVEKTIEKLAIAPSKKTGDEAEAAAAAGERKAAAVERKAPPSAEDLVRYKSYIGAKWSGACRWFNVIKGEEAKQNKFYGGAKCLFYLEKMFTVF